MSYDYDIDWGCSWSRECVLSVLCRRLVAYRIYAGMKQKIHSLTQPSLAARRIFFRVCVCVCAFTFL